jgi:hypothetical protein
MPGFRRRRTQYAIAVTFNPGDTGSGTILSNGNLTATGGNVGATGPYVARGNVGHSTGKYYFEFKIDNASGTNGVVGLAASTVVNTSNMNSAVAGDFVTYSVGINAIYKGNPQASNTPGAIITTNDVCGIAVDFDAGKIWFAKNNVYILSGNPAAGTNESWLIPTGIVYYPAVNPRSVAVFTARFKLSSLQYAAPNASFLIW